VLGAGKLPLWVEVVAVGVDITSCFGKDEESEVSTISSSNIFTGVWKQHCHNPYYGRLKGQHATKVRLLVFISIYWMGVLSTTNHQFSVKPHGAASHSLQPPVGNYMEVFRTVNCFRTRLQNLLTTPAPQRTLNRISEHVTRFLQ
jgi:hypothetical protein